MSLIPLIIKYSKETRRPVFVIYCNKDSFSCGKGSEEQRGISLFLISWRAECKEIAKVNCSGSFESFSIPEIIPQVERVICRAPISNPSLALRKRNVSNTAS